MNFIENENEKAFVKYLTKNRIISHIKGHVKRSSDDQNEVHTSFVNQLIRSPGKDREKFQYTSLREIVRTNVNTSKDLSKLLPNKSRLFIPKSHQVSPRLSPNQTQNITERNIKTANFLIPHSIHSLESILNNEDILNLNFKPEHTKSKFATQRGSEESSEVNPRYAGFGLI
jgi:hypothetical protein